MGNEQNPYQAYTDGSIFSDNPLNLVIALYQGAQDATQQAESALRSGDILGRSRAINKAFAILTELLVTLDHERGGEISQNLKRLYTYMQSQLLAAHARQAAEPLAEVRSLLGTLLEGWRGAALKPAAAAPEHFSPAVEQASARQESAHAAYANAPIYGGYMDDSFASSAYTSYSF